MQLRVSGFDNKSDGSICSIVNVLDSDGKSLFEDNVNLSKHNTRSRLAKVLEKQFPGEFNADDVEKRLVNALSQHRDIEATINDTEPPAGTGRGKMQFEYEVCGGELCLVKNSKDYGEYLHPLSTFVPQIDDEVIRDDGLSEDREYIISGKLTDNRHLPPCTVKESDFPGMNWARKSWGAKANIYPGSTAKEHVRSYLQLSRNGSEPRRIFTHTGWRECEGKHVYLTGSGGLGADNVEVELGGRLDLYSLPTDLSATDPVGAMKTSISFMDFGRPDVMTAIWSTMYLAPLTELLNPAFTLWLHGHSGSFKSVISALALCHFGTFTHLTLPTSWEYTANRLGREMFVLKDIPLVIDDWSPGATMAAQRDMENKVAIVVRAQGNRQGRGRLNADSSARKDFTPRGLVVTSGEQLPGGESITARLLILDMEPGDIQKAQLDIAQIEAPLYSYAMASYILAISNKWGDIVKVLPEKWIEYRDKGLAEGLHLRLPATVAWLYLALEAGLVHAHQIGAIKKPELKERLNSGWNNLLVLASRQGARVNEERAANRFVEAFRTLLTQERIVLIDTQYCQVSDIRDYISQKSRSLKPHENFVGWEDDEYYCLIPKAAYAAVSEFYSRSGTPFTFKASAVWRDLRQLGMTECEKGRDTKVIWVGPNKDDGQSARVIKLRKGIIRDVQ